MSKRDDGVRMKPMYRTAAEERLILAAIGWTGTSKGVNGCRCSTCRLVASVLAVVSERGKKRRVKPDKPYVASMWPSPKFRGV